MDFEKARNAHADWKLRLKGLIAGKGDAKLDPVQVAKDDGCELGRWIHGEARKLCAKQPQLLDELRAAHARFHVSASEVVARAATGDRVGAQELLGGGSSFTRCSVEVNSLLLKMEAAVPKP